MLGFLLILAFCAVVALAFFGVMSRLKSDWDPAEQLGWSGLIGLGSVGMLTLFVGLLPNGLRWGFAAIIVAILAIGASTFKSWDRSQLKFDGRKNLGMTVIFGLLLLFPLVASLSPSTAMDWDSIAYHLAVPKMWLQDGQIHKVLNLHHSNFPFSIDNLYIWGLALGGESGAKAFSFAILVFGVLAVYGTARRSFPDSQFSGLIAGLILAGSPVILWESGTAYIDVAHGLYAGLGVFALGEFLLKSQKQEALEKSLWLAVLGLGLTAGTKYTGLQAIFAAAMGSLIFSIRTPKVAFNTALIVGLGAFLVASPWYIKTAIYTGNPVYPFFYDKLGGENWGDWHAEIYQDEQRSFGVAPGEPRNFADIGHAVLGLAYQPGRYVNPGQTVGAGFPTGAVGFAAMAILFMGAAMGGSDRRVKFSLAWCGLILLMWFVLSQQSRYLTMLVVPAALIAPSLVRNRNWRYGLLAIAGVQCLYTLFTLHKMQFATQLKVLTGQIDRDAYVSASTPFAESAKVLNANPSFTKIALYEEVFGFYLEKPYIWANPGHGTAVPCLAAESGVDYADQMKALGYDTVYLNRQFWPRRDENSTRENLAAWIATTDRWMEAAGLIPGEPYQDDEREIMKSDPNLYYRYLLADAVRSGRLIPQEEVGPGIIFVIN